jgi:hypothetical protein
VFIFNILGIVFGLGAFGVGYLACHLVTGDGNSSYASLGNLVAGSVACAVDLAYRAMKAPATGRWRFIHPVTGGQLIFVPIWVFGVIWIVVGCLDFAAGGNQARAQNNAFMEDTLALLDKTVTALKAGDNAEDEKGARDLVILSERKLREMADLYERLDKAEKGRLDRKYADRINPLIQQVRLRWHR